MQNNTYLAIMAGGVGSRFWPGSREARPKQFLDILGIGKTLLQMTYERSLSLCPKENIYIITNIRYRDLVLEQLPELTAEQVMCEPSRNNTAPCLAYAAFKLRSLNPNAVMVVASSDHLVVDVAGYAAQLQKAIDYAAHNNALVTIAIHPSRPDTGYGYIRYGAKELANGVHKVLEFKEKPNYETAVKFVESGEYLWNSGMFVWSVNSILAAFAKYAPDIYHIFEGIAADMNTPNEQAAIDEWYPQTRNISIDFAIMEKADNVCTVPSNFGWSDLGTWNSLHAEVDKDENDNALLGKHIRTYDSATCIVRAPKHKLVIIKGLENFIVVDEDDVLLIFPKDDEQEIKAVTNDLKASGYADYL